MKKLIHAELLKLRSTRAFYGYAMAALAFVPVTVSLAIFTAGQPGGGPDLASSEGIRHVLSAASSGTTIVLILGILVMSGEFRHNTATSTFLVTPDRTRVVLAKLAASALVGTVLAAVSALVTLAVAVPWLAAKGVEVDIFSSDVGFAMLGALAATALYAVVGVGVGGAFRNQTVAVVVALIWVSIAESLLVSFLPEVGRWLPGGAATALTGVATASGGLLPMWGGALLFTVYGLAFAAAGIRFVTHRDIT